jgi:phosphopantetheinyl transferase
MHLSNIHSIQINSETEVFLLSYNEFDPKIYLTHLTEKEQERLENIKHNTRKMEFVATRILRTEIMGKKEVHYSPIGAPVLDDGKFISISHTYQMVGIAVSSYQIGFDLEPIRDKAKKLTSKFLHKEELAQLDVLNDLEMTTAWSMKECLYKLAGRKEIIFKTDLRIAKKDDFWTGKIINTAETIFVKMKTYHSGNNVLAINSEPIEIK